MKKFLFFLFFISMIPPVGVASELVEYGRASWYSSTDACRHNSTKNCLMANGESLYAAEKDREYFIASYKYPLGSKIRVTNEENSKSVVGIVKDRGPNKRLGRICDLSRSAFQRIANFKKGIIKVKVEVI